MQTIFNALATLGGVAALFWIGWYVYCLATDLTPLEARRRSGRGPQWSIAGEQDQATSARSYMTEFRADAQKTNPSLSSPDGVDQWGFAAGSPLVTTCPDVPGLSSDQADAPRSLS